MATPPCALELRAVSYAFKKLKALSGATFSVPSASLHGFVGPNGAGKTTTLKIAATLLRPQTGSVRVFGVDAARSPNKVRGRLGFMPDHLSMYRQMTVFEYLDFFAAAYGQALSVRTRTIEDVLKLTDMHARRTDLIRTLSRGMQQRVSLARALVHDPDLLLLDEPASGLDPRARIELMEILRELQRLGKTVFISSHILSELATLCDSVTIIDHGRIQFTGSMSDLLAGRGGPVSYELGLESPCPGLAAALGSLQGVAGAVAAESGMQYRITIDPTRADSSSVLRAALGAGAAVSMFRREQKQLDQAFLDLTRPGICS